MVHERVRREQLERAQAHERGGNPPVGIVPCADKGDSLVEYTLPEGNAQLFAAEYLSRPPSREELALELSAEYRALDEAAVG